MATIHSEIEVCQCCMLVIANGECCGMDHGDFHINGPEPLSAWDGYTPAVSFALGDSDDNGFSWSSCEGCGSSLGGDRYAVTVFYRES